MQRVGRRSRTCALRAAFVLSMAGACASNRTPPLRDMPDNPMQGVTARSLYDTGIALAGQGDHVRAEQYLVASMQAGMAEERVMLPLLRVCVQASRYRAAVNYANPYLDQHPHDWRLRYLVGTIMAGLDENHSARRQFEAVLADNAGHAEAHYMLASLLREKLNDAVTADAHFRRYLEIEPAGPHAEEARAGLLRQVSR